MYCAKCTKFVILIINNVTLNVKNVTLIVNNVYIVNIYFSVIHFSKTEVISRTVGNEHGRWRTSQLIPNL